MAITSRQIHEICAEIAGRVQADQATCEKLQRQYDSAERMEMVREVHERHALTVGRILAPLTVDIESLPLLRGSAITVPHATELRSWSAEHWNARLLVRLEEWSERFPTLCGVKFQQALDAFSEQTEAAYWLEHRGARLFADDSQNRT